MSESTTTVGQGFETLVEALAAAPADKPFVTMWKSETDIETLTFEAFRRQAQAHAQYFRSLGVRNGETVILIMPQGIQLMSAFTGAMLLGAIPAILAYPNFKVEPSKYRFGLAGVSANLKASLTVVDEGFPQDLMAHIAADGTSRIARCPDAFPAQPTPKNDQAVHPDQIAFIQHSAGTTGLQKGVALTHRAVLKQISNLAPAIQLSSRDRIYSWLPLYHDMGLIACFMLPLACHLAVLMQSPIDWVMQPRTMLELIGTERCTLAWVPNFALQFLARRVRPQDRAGIDLSSLRALINCSEPVRASSMDEFTSAFASHGLRPRTLQSCYAMAETVFAATQSDMASPEPRRIWIETNAFRKQGLVRPVSSNNQDAICFVSSGRPLANTQIRVVSETGENLVGKVGEIAIHSESMLDGYYNRPDLTEKAVRGGWYYSGDLGFLSDDELFVVGRKKDLIIVAGENIYPQDVEEIVSSHSAICDGRVVAFGKYNSNLGTEEIVVVAEVRENADLTHAQTIERELRNAVKAELGIAVGHLFIKPPRWIVKSTAGKPARGTTREKLLTEHPTLRENSADA
ncbi:MAG TPA: AMP-binding protein [Candidatus Acidoferrales bacterium]|nr:AMP-binding protein [Candidatus Acidoferrales bacterium]